VATVSALHILEQAAARRDQTEMAEQALQTVLADREITEL
jgi:hypothetical protein